jgi:DNA-binding MarR family transcriptional regulator
LVDRLVQHGLAERGPDPGDRRVLRVAVSESAAAAVRDFEQERSRRIAALLAPLSEDELETLIVLAERIVADASNRATEEATAP